MSARELILHARHVHQGNPLAARWALACAEINHRSALMDLAPEAMPERGNPEARTEFYALQAERRMLRREIEAIDAVLRERAAMERRAA